MHFEYALSATFLMLAAALIGSTALAVRFGLRPLRALRDGLIAIRRGEAEHIVGEFPEDLAPLAAELNLLLDANREVVRRARTQVGNLAHALKTPLSVIVNEAEAGSPRLADKVREQAEVMSRQVTFYLDRARAAARATSIGAATDFGPVLDGLLRTFQKVYRDRGSAFESADAAGPEVSRRVAGSRRSRRQPARQRRQVGARRGSRSPPSANLCPTPSGRSYFLCAYRRRRARARHRRARGGARARPAARRIAPRLRARPLDRGRPRRQLRRRAGARRQPARGAAGDVAAARVLSRPGPLIPY